LAPFQREEAVRGAVRTSDTPRKNAAGRSRTVLSRTILETA